MVQQRAKNETDPAVLAKHGEGGKFPLYYSDLAENGNYLEPEEIAVRKGVCGDPRLVSALSDASLSSIVVAWGNIPGVTSPTPRGSYRRDEAGQ